MGSGHAVNVNFLLFSLFIRFGNANTYDVISTPNQWTRARGWKNSHGNQIFNLKYALIATVARRRLANKQMQCTIRSQGNIEYVVHPLFDTQKHESTVQTEIKNSIPKKWIPNLDGIHTGADVCCGINQGPSRALVNIRNVKSRSVLDIVMFRPSKLQVTFTQINDNKVYMNWEMVHLIISYVRRCGHRAFERRKFP